MAKNHEARQSYAAEVYKRVETISEMIMRGYQRKHILQYGVKWDVKNRTIDKYIAMANKMLIKQSEKDFDRNYAKAIQRYEDLYIKALDNDDYGLAKAINKDFVELTGVKAPDKQEITEHKITIVEPEFN